MLHPAMHVWNRSSLIAEQERRRKCSGVHKTGLLYIKTGSAACGHSLPDRLLGGLAAGWLSHTRFPAVSEADAKATWLWW